MEALQVLIAVTHHSLVDIPHPIGCGKGESKSDDNHDSIGYRIVEDCLKNEYQGNRYEEHDEFYDQLELVLKLVLTSYLVIQGQGGLVPYRKLEKQTVFWSCGYQQISENHQQRELP